MLTQKGPGVISCIQKSQDGPIEYSKELPVPTGISKGLKTLITPILRGLLETRPAEKISYEDFFQRIKEIMAMKVRSNKDIRIVSLYLISFFYRLFWYSFRFYFLVFFLIFLHFFCTFRFFFLGN